MGKGSERGSCNIQKGAPKKLTGTGLMKTKENLEKEAAPNAMPQPAHLADLIWHYYQGEQTDAFDKILSFSLEAEKVEFAIELLKLRKLDQIYGAIDQIAVKGIRALVKEV